MKKKILSILLAGAMGATLLAGCGSSSSDSTSTDNSAETTDDSASSGEAKEVKLTVMTPAEDQDDATGNWVKTECEKFAEENADKWKLSFDYVQCSEADAKDTVTQDPASAADVYMYANDQITDLVNAGALAKLGGDAESQVKSQNSESMVKTVSLDGSIYGVPYNSNTWFMYYDNRVLSEDDVKTLEGIMAKGKFSFPIANGWYNVAFYASNGCTLYGDGTDTDAGIDFSGDKATAVTKALAELVKNPNFLADTSDAGTDMGISGFQDGSVVAMVDGDWDYKTICDALGGEENVGCAQLPTWKIDGADCQLKAFFGSKALGVNPNCKDQDAAVALAAYLGSDDAQIAHFEMRHVVPSSESCVSNADVAAFKATQAKINTVANTAIIQPASGMDSYWDAMKAMGAALANNEINADNAAEKTEELNSQLNGSLVQ